MNDKIRKLKTAIEDDRLATSTAKLNVYNTRNDVY